MNVEGMAQELELNAIADCSAVCQRGADRKYQISFDNIPIRNRWCRASTLEGPSSSPELWTHLRESDSLAPHCTDLSGARLELSVQLKYRWRRMSRMGQAPVVADAVGSTVAMGWFLIWN